MPIVRMVLAGAVGCLWLSTACDFASGQISAEEGRWVVSRGADIASRSADFIKTEYGDRTSGEAFENAELVRLVTAAPSSWRFYSRDRGILIAIDASADVSLKTHNSGRAKIARAAEAVIRQEREMPIANRVTVVFIDPAVHAIAARRPPSHPAYSQAFPISGSLNWDNGISYFGSAPSAGSFMSHACDCR